MDEDQMSPTYDYECAERLREAVSVAMEGCVGDIERTNDLYGSSSTISRPPRPDPIWNAPCTVSADVADDGYEPEDEGLYDEDCDNGVGWCPDPDCEICNY